MTVFAIIAALMTLAALAIILRPLLGKIHSSDTERNKLNVAIFKQRLDELEKDLQQGQISQGEYEVACKELELQLANDIPAAHEQPAKPAGSGLGERLVILVAIPAVTITLYILLGTPAAIEPEQRQAAATAHGQQGTPSVEEMVARLEQRVQDAPEDNKALRMLAKAYSLTRNFTKAEQTYARLTEREQDNADNWADYADIAAVNQKGSLDGKPYTYIKRALSLQPRHPKALWLAGTYHFQREEYKKAIRFWTIVNEILPPESQNAQMIRDSIAEARKKLGLPEETQQAASASPVNIRGRADIGQAIRAKVAPGDTVFITAKASSGPRMPLAVVRKTVADLPVDFELNDSMAMMPDFRISGFEEVIVSARISKSGNAIAQSGDYISNRVLIDTRKPQAVHLTISDQVP